MSAAASVPRSLRVRPLMGGAALALVVGACVVAVVACGSEDEPSGPSGSGGATASTAAGAGGGGGCGDVDCMPFDPASDYAALTKGVSVLDSGGAVPSAMVVYGDTAFPVALDADHHTFIAAAHVGAGRVVAFAHEAFLGGAADSGDDRGVLVDNALRWVSGKSAPVVGLGAGLESLAARCEAAGLVVKPFNGTDLAGIDALVVSTYAKRSDAEVGAIAAFVAKGGGLITGGQAWSSSGGPVPVAVGYPGNVLLRDAGIVVTDAYAGIGTSSVGAAAPGPLEHAGRALSLLAEHVTGKAPLPLAEQERGAATVTFAVDVLPIAVQGFFAKAQAILDASPPPVPTEAKPFKPSGQPIAVLELHLQSKLAQELPAASVKAHPAASDFPGAVPPSAKPVSRTLTIDGSYAGRDPHYAFAAPQADVWRGTGLYAAPGSVVHVSVGAAHAGKGLGVEIGAHTDTLWQLDAWPRFPRLDRWDRLDATTIDTASAFGGPIYITVPPGASLGAVTVTIDGAFEAPRFVAGETTPAQWKVLRDAPAPWAELESSKFAITVPSSTIRTLDDPAAVLALWDKVLDADADLAAIPRARARAERFVTDREISAGYLHSGYPIMAHLDGAPMVLDVAAIAKDGSWGPFHELGHNHQWSDWVLPGSTEASVNLWSVYVSETVLGIPRAKAHPALDPAERAKRIADYAAGGAKFADWSVWTSLETYLQLEEAFGWGAFESVFKEYQTLPDVEAPKDDAARIDQFAVRFAKTVKKDLGPFFVAWGFPLSVQALATMAALPAWPENPMGK